jgi:hypothetical protein
MRPRLVRPILRQIILFWNVTAVGFQLKHVITWRVWNDRVWHNVRAQLGPFEGTETAALPTLGINGQFTVYGAGLEPMPALANLTFDRAGAANGGSPPLTSKCAWCSIGHKRPLAAVHSLDQITLHRADSGRSFQVQQSHGSEGRLSGTFQTWFRRTLNAYS